MWSQQRAFYTRKPSTNTPAIPATLQGLGLEMGSLGHVKSLGSKLLGCEIRILLWHLGMHAVGLGLGPATIAWKDCSQLMKKKGADTPRPSRAPVWFEDSAFQAVSASAVHRFFCPAGVRRLIRQTTSYFCSEELFMICTAFHILTSECYMLVRRFCL